MVLVVPHKETLITWLLSSWRFLFYCSSVGFLPYCHYMLNEGESYVSECLFKLKGAEPGGQSVICLHRVTLLFYKFALGKQ